MEKTTAQRNDLPSRQDRYTGLLLGTAVGDALGLPREGLSRRRARALFGNGPLNHHFLGRQGWCSDDTEHSCMVAQALLNASLRSRQASKSRTQVSQCREKAEVDVDRFAQNLGWALRGWLLSLPAGIGWGTLRACLKLCLGWSPQHSGVNSAGNGPAMRVALLGLMFCHDIPMLESTVAVCTQITHTHPRALDGARLISHAVAVATQHLEQCASLPEPTALLQTLQARINDTELRAALLLAQRELEQQQTVESFANALGQTQGVTGYVAHTVPVCLYAWLRHPQDFERAVESVILLGGDTDTTAAIVGALSGACLGQAAIPSRWLRDLAEWPRDVRWLQQLGLRLAHLDHALHATEGFESVEILRALPWPRIGLLLRNPLYTFVVLCHGLRRMFPPYK